MPKSRPRLLALALDIAVAIIVFVRMIVMIGMLAS
jgi:hypothetical protein